MKIHFPQESFDQIDTEIRAALKPSACACISDGKAEDDCSFCNGSGTVYEYELPADALKRPQSQGTQDAGGDRVVRIGFGGNNARAE